MCDAAEPAAFEVDGAFRGVVVLHDGGVLSGAILRSGERYLVTTGTRELNIAAANVEFVCGSIEEAYERRRANAETPTAETHLELADWCLGQDLLPQAARELIDARAHDARHPKLNLLERRLIVAREPRKDPAVMQAASVEIKPSVKELVDSPPANDAARLRILASDLPEGAIERFTRKIQPLLVNSCATAGCHQMDGTQEFQLDRSLLHGMANRRSTTHNLQAALALIDRAQPKASRLLTVPRRPHGEMEEAVFGPHDAKLVEQLTEWVALVTFDEQKAVAEAAEAARKKAAIAANAHYGDEVDGHLAPDGVMQAHLPAPEGRNARQPGQRNSTAAVESAHSNAAAITEEAMFKEGASLRPTPRLRYGAQLKRDEARDEFDPEIFNERYGRVPGTKTN